MSKVLVMGATLPRYHPKQSVTIAANLRTEQFVIALQQAGNNVITVGSDYHGAPLKKGHFTKGVKGYYYTDMVGDKLHKEVSSLIKKEKPDCLVGITVWPSMELVKVGSDLPMWIDCFGNTMTEAQLKCAETSDNQYLKQFWAYEKKVLARGDKFSGCSERQEHFMVAELALLGRLSAETHGYRFVYSIPPGIPDSVPEPSWKGTSIRGHDGVSDDDFVVLWTGSYNLWTDIDTLFKGLELAMAENDKVRFVSFGGEIRGHDELTYGRFVKLVEASRFKDRFGLLGWQPYQRMLKALTEANVGICIDKWHYELVYGTRTRLTQMIAHGLPVITTKGCELTDDWAICGMCRTFGIGDALSLAEALASPPMKGTDLSVRARYSYEATCKPLADWCNAPSCAPASQSLPVYDATRFDVVAGLIQYASCRIREGKDALAIGPLKIAMELSPDCASAAYHLGSIYERMGKHENARILFAQILEDPILAAGAYYHYACNHPRAIMRVVLLDKCLEKCPGHKAAKRMRKQVIKQLHKNS